MTVPAPAANERAVERVLRLADHFRVPSRINGGMGFAIPCPVHHGDGAKFEVVAGNESEYPLLTCRTGCRDELENDRPAWLTHAVRALLAAGAPADCLPLATGALSRSAATTARTEGHRSVAGRGGRPLPDDEQVDRWQGALIRQPLLLRALCDKWEVSEDSVVMADVGYQKSSGRLIFPVRDLATGEVVQVLYRDFNEGAEQKVKSHPGVTGSYVYAPFGIDADRTVILCAGEHDLFSAHEVGLNAVSFTGGEGAVPPAERLEVLAGARVVVAYDIDAPGRAGARKVAAALADAGATVAVADLSSVPGLPDKGDLADVLHLHGLEKLNEALAEADAWAGGERSSWLARDLTDVLRDGYEPQQTSVLGRADGVALFYRGLKHVLVAESEAGKTWLALLAAVEQMRTDEHVVFYDFEDTEHGVVGRLLALGCDQDLIRRFFHYARPDEPLTDGLRQEAVEALRSLAPSLVIVDGVTEAMALHGWEINSNNDVALFYKSVLSPFADLGAAVVALDHLPKDDTKRRGSIGGVHKLNGVDGAVYRMESVKQIIPGREGLSRVLIDKDRPGQVRKYQDQKKRIAELWVFSSDDGTVRASLEMPETVGASEEDKRASNKAINATGKRIQGVLGVRRETTARELEKQLNRAGTPTSLSTIQRWLRVLGDMGHAAVREDATGERPVFYWTGVEKGATS